MKLKVHIQPNAKKNEVVGIHGDSIKIKIKAQPVDGEANEALVKFLGKILNITQKNIRIVHGQTGKTKLLEIETQLSINELTEILLASNKIG